MSKDKVSHELYAAVCCNKSVDELRRLIELGADPNYIPCKLWSTLTVAIVRGNLENVTFLLKSGATTRTYDIEMAETEVELNKHSSIELPMRKNILEAISHAVKV